MITGYLIYILKVALFHALCYAGYWTLFRKSNLFSLNRAFLLATLILGFIAPLVVLPVAVSPAELVIPELNITEGTFSELETGAIAASTTSRLDVTLLTDAIYFAGVLLLTLRSVLDIRSIQQIKANAIEDPSTSPRVFRTKEPMSFSFINTILLRESEDPLVFLHEKGHIAGKHWMDLIFMEIVCVVCWINPVVRLYRKSLKQQHEYLADDYVLKRGASRENYLQCIFNSLTLAEPIGPIHKFNSQSLKQRILMMTKDQISPHTRMLYLGIVPLVALLFFSFTEKNEQAGPIANGKIFVIDAAHGGSDAGALTATGIAEKEIALKLARLVHDIGKQKGLNIQLTRTTDKQLSLQDRLDFCREMKADVFLSLHLGSEPEGSQGCKMYVSENNAEYTDSKRIAAIVGQALDDIAELTNPQVHNSGAFVLTRNHAASMILEVGNLSNPQDATFINDPANQRKLAEKIVSALLAY